MADYTAFVEAGNSLVEVLRDHLTPEPISNRELISLCTPHESENNQLTVHLFHLEEDAHNNQAGFYQFSQDVQRVYPTRYQLSFLITAHSKAPAQLREADQYRMMGAAVQAIKDMPVLDRKYLQGSLLDTGAELRLSVERPPFDQLIKIWNNTSSAYKLSIICKVIGVELESRRTRRIERVRDVEINIDPALSGPKDAPLWGESQSSGRLRAR